MLKHYVVLVVTKDGKQHNLDVTGPASEAVPVSAMRDAFYIVTQRGYTSSEIIRFDMALPY